MTITLSTAVRWRLCAALGVVIATLILVLCLGCSSTSLSVAPDGTLSYRSDRALNDVGLDEASYDPATGQVRISGARSEQSKLIDLFQSFVAQRGPVVPIGAGGVPRTGWIDAELRAMDGRAVRRAAAGAGR